MHIDDLHTTFGEAKRDRVAAAASIRAKQPPVAVLNGDGRAGDTSARSRHPHMPSRVGNRRAACACALAVCDYGHDAAAPATMRDPNSEGVHGLADLAPATSPSESGIGKPGNRKAHSQLLLTPKTPTQDQILIRRRSTGIHCRGLAAANPPRQRNNQAERVAGTPLCTEQRDDASHRSDHAAATRQRGSPRGINLRERDARALCIRGRKHADQSPPSRTPPTRRCNVKLRACGMSPTPADRTADPVPSTAALAQRAG